MNKYFRAACLAVLLSSCHANDPALLVSMKKQSLNIAVEISSYDKKQVGQSKKIFVFGELVAEDKNKKISSINLDCISLKLDNHLSEGIYVKSVAHYLKDHFQADEQGKVTVPVYWVFDDTEILNLSHADKYLELSDNQQCVFYEGEN